MAWTVGNQKVIPTPDLIEVLRKNYGGKTMSEHIAKITLAKYLKSNLGITFKMMSGIDIELCQELILKGLFVADSSLVVAGRGVGKCAKWNTLIPTTKGLKKIVDIEVGDYVQAKKEVCKVLGKTINPIESGLKITAKGGFSFEGKVGHKTLTYDTLANNFTFKEITDLKHEDLLVLRKDNGGWGDKDIFEGFDFSKNRHFNETNINIKNEIEFYYFLGLFTGDGYFNDRGVIVITSEDEEILEFCKKKYQEYLPETKITIIQKPKTVAKEIRIHSKMFFRFLKYLGYSEKNKAYQKIIPPLILETSAEKIQAYLRGLFDTDGWSSLTKNTNKNATRLNIGFDSSSYELIQTVQNLLLNLGIVSSVREKHPGGEYVIMGVKCNTNPSFALTITGFDNIKQFSNQIGFGLKRKQSNIDEFINLYQSEKDYCSNLIPIGNYLKNKYGSAHFRNKYFKIHKNLSVNRLKECLDNNLFDEKDTILFKEIIENNLFFRSIKSISPVEVKTVDIQVEGEECYVGNGIIHHNSWLIAVYCVLASILCPNSHICLISSNFRSSRRILENADRMTRDKKASLLRQCFPFDMRRGNDIFEWKLSNNSRVFALPLSTGEGLRGTRATICIVDEGLLISREIQEVIIRPFLTAKQNFQEERDIREAEDYLIKEGAITEKDRMSFPRNKYMVFSSASYQFEYLYEMYASAIEYIRKPPTDSDNPPRQFVFRASYELLGDKSFIEKTQIDLARSNHGENSEYFKKEYRGLFSEGGDSYFNPKKMHECTVEDGESPCTQICGDKEVKYLLSIDPSYSAAKSSDFFAMSVHMLIPEERRIVLVHTYAKAGAEIKDHFIYLSYLLTHFNIVFTMIDDSGTEFIHGFNESVVAKANNLKLQFLTADFDNGENYAQEISIGKREYNITAKKFVYGQRFNTDSIRRMNEHLQNCIEGKKVWFASKAARNKNLDKYMAIDLPFDFKDKNDKKFGKIEFIEDQDNWIKETKAQTALIEIKVNPMGSIQFDLPQNLRRSDSPNRARKDCYTTLMMANYGAKFYFDMLFTPDAPQYNTFTPIIIR